MVAVCVRTDIDRRMLLIGTDIGRRMLLIGTDIGRRMLYIGTEFDRWVHTRSHAHAGVHMHAFTCVHRCAHTASLSLSRCVMHNTTETVLAA